MQLTTSGYAFCFFRGARREKDDGERDDVDDDRRSDGVGPRFDFFVVTVSGRATGSDVIPVDILEIVRIATTPWSPCFRRKSRRRRRRRRINLKRRRVPSVIKLKFDASTPGRQHVVSLFNRRARSPERGVARVSRASSSSCPARGFGVDDHLAWSRPRTRRSPFPPATRTHRPESQRSRPIRTRARRASAPRARATYSETTARLERGAHPPTASSLVVVVVPRPRSRLASSSCRASSLSCRVSSRSFSSSSRVVECGDRARRHRDETTRTGARGVTS